MNDQIAWMEQVGTEYRPIPFWSWNDRLEPEELRRQIAWMEKMGIGGFFMHARGGLKTPYLEREWMDAVKLCCEEGRKRGMHPWLYDENGWPSGFAGGKLLEDEANRDRYLHHSIGAFDPDADISYSLAGEKLVRVTDGSAPGEYLNITVGISASTVDILNPQVVKKFLNITHEAYKSHLGENFAQLAAGFFTDEPQYYRWGTPYTPMLEDYFREHYGLDIRDQLGLLFVEKAGFRAFRYRYWLAMQRLMLESFAKQIYAWCEDNGVRFTGHYVEEPSMGGQLMCCGGVMPFYEFEHIPGIDWLGKETDNEISPRQVGSAARQLGKNQVLTETFGCCGWNITPRDLKRVAGFQYACGTNLMCHHLMPYSEHGQRKRDYPAHFHPANPWIKEDFREFNDYFTRLGYLLANSEEPVNVAMLHPIRSAYLHYSRGEDAGAIPLSELDPDLRRACRTLSSRGIGYHFLDETLLERHGSVENGQIRCGNCSYTYLVLPKLLTVGKHTEKLLRQFVTQGGKLLLLDTPPIYLEGEEYDFSFLLSSCTLAEIQAAQPFGVTDTQTELYYTYRIWEGKPFLFVQNASGKRAYTQGFAFPGGIRSFRALDLNTGEAKDLPLTLTLEKNEGLLLFPSTENIPELKHKIKLSHRFVNGNVAFANNFLTLDTVRYSTNGTDYSQPILCSDLFQKLLRQRYEGKIYLQYEFTAEYLPENLFLLAERSDALHKLNGQPFRFDQAVPDAPELWRSDIRPYLQIGKNTYETELIWHQSQQTYYALFGEGVTESLKNCIAYDSEIESVYLAGHFGVYSASGFREWNRRHLLGSDFHIGPPPKTLSETVTDGLPFFRGKLTLRENIFLAEPNTVLTLPGDYLTAEVSLNGASAGRIFLNESLDISSVAKPGENALEVTFTVGNRNLLGPFHMQGAEDFVSPAAFELCDLPLGQNGCPQYKLRRFYADDL